MKLGTNALQQGHADGMCGLYSILNFLMTLKDWRKEGANKGLEYVLEAAQAQGVLGPSWLVNGYRDGDLKLILNNLFERWWLPYRANFVCELVQRHYESAYDVYRRVLDAKGSVIGGREGKTHWVLITRIAEGKDVIMDSSSGDKSIRSFDARAKDHCCSDGIAILQISRAVVEIEP